MLINSYESNHPDKKSKKGFVQATMNDKIILVEELKINDIISLETSRVSVKTKVLDVTTY